LKKRAWKSSLQWTAGQTSPEKTLAKCLAPANTCVAVTGKPETVLDKDKVDIVTLATTSWAQLLVADLRKILAAGINCVTIAEEMADPAAQNPALAAEIDALAKANGVSVLGTGVNPGFVLDLLIVTLTGGCHSVERIEASRVNDLSPYGPTVMKSQGVGTTPQAFQAGVANGSIVGHVGFPESIHIISDALGLGVDRIEQSREPIISTVYRETPHVKVEPGMVAGCAHIGVGYRGDREVIRLVHPQQIHPQLEKQATGDYIHIYGKPEVHMSIQPEMWRHRPRPRQNMIPRRRLAWAERDRLPAQTA
jgi:4-hydroxy-tetrahydrodipicolinate reductase